MPLSTLLRSPGSVTSDILGLARAWTRPCSAFRRCERGYPSVSSDTGGYQTDPGHPHTMPPLLFLRSAQWNALTPFFLIGGHDEHRPWKFDRALLQTFRRYMWLHQELIPSSILNTSRRACARER